MNLNDGCFFQYYSAVLFLNINFCSSVSSSCYNKAIYFVLAADLTDLAEAV